MGRTLGGLRILESFREKTATIEVGPGRSPSNKSRNGRLSVSEINRPSHLFVWTPLKKSSGGWRILLTGKEEGRKKEGVSRNYGSYGLPLVSRPTLSTKVMSDRDTVRRSQRSRHFTLFQEQ